MQTVLDGLIASSAFLPIALGFFLFYRVSGVLHFAHGALIPVGGYAFLSFVRNGYIPLYGAALLAVFLVACCGMTIEVLFYRRLRHWDVGHVRAFVVSFSLYLIIVSLLSLTFGDATQVWRQLSLTAGASMLGARASVVRWGVLLFSVVALCSTWFWLYRSRIGTQIRAVAANPFLADAIGMNVPRLRLFTIAVASVLAAISGILTTLDTGISPISGMSPLLLGVIAVFVGGRSLAGVVVGSLIIGMSQHLATYWVASRWQDTIAFALLTLVLLLRPSGLFGGVAPRVET